MVTKQQLKKKLDLEREENSKLKQKLSFLEAENTSLITEREEHQKKSMHTKGMADIIGLRTMVANYFSIALDYLTHGEQDKAEQILDIIFETKKEDRIRLFRYEDRRQKKGIFMLNGEVQSAKLIDIWRAYRYHDLNSATASSRVYSVVNEDRNKNPTLEVPLTPEPICGRKYIIIKEISGLDMFSFFSELEQQKKYEEQKRHEEQTKQSWPKEQASNRSHQRIQYLQTLKDAVLEKLLRDTAYFTTRNFGLPHGLIELSECEEKLVGTIKRYASDGLSHAGEEKLRNIGRLLNAGAVYNFRDAGLWNTRISNELNNELLSEQPKSHEEIDELLRNGLFQYDFDTITRKTFISDDAIHILESPVVELTDDEIMAKDNYFISHMMSRGLNTLNTQDYFSTRKLGSFYRNLRLWELYESKLLADESGEFGKYHLTKSYSSLYHHLRGLKPSEQELKKISLESIISLVN